MLSEIARKAAGLSGDAARDAYSDAVRALERVYGKGGVWGKATDAELETLEGIERRIGLGTPSGVVAQQEPELPRVGSSMKREDLKPILDAIADNDGGYYGIRSMPDGQRAEVGGGVAPSRVWGLEPGSDSDWMPLDEFADGPSAIDLGKRSALSLADEYTGEKALLRAEDILPLQHWNLDYGEIVMRDPIVQAVFDSDGEGTWTRVRSLAPLAVGGAAAGGLMASPESAWAGDRTLPPTDAIEEAWNPVEALAGGLGGGIRAALMGVPVDALMDYGMGKIGGLMGGHGGPTAQDYGGGMGWR